MEILIIKKTLALALLPERERINVNIFLGINN